jgi:hypothetical protein
LAEARSREANSQVFVWTLVAKVDGKQNLLRSVHVLRMDETKNLRKQMAQQEGLATADTSGLLTPTVETRLFSGINALGYSAGVAVLAGLATCAGMVRESGTGDNDQEECLAVRDFDLLAL